MKNLIKFNESSKFFEIKSLVDNLKDMLVELNDANISYQIEPSNEIRVKFVSLGKDGYFYVFLKNLESKKDSYNLIIENIKMIIDYMDGNGFETTLTAKYSMNKDTYTGVVTMNRLLMEFESRRPVYFLQLDFIMKNKPLLECLPNEKSIKQLEMVAKLSKKTDIGNRISDMNKEGANIHWIQNPIDTGIESREDYENNNRKKMKHLKKFNESISNHLLEFCQENLVSLSDKDFAIAPYSVNGISISQPSNKNITSVFTWGEIKDDFIPFFETLNEKYEIIDFNRGGDDSAVTFSNTLGNEYFSYEDVIEDYIDDDTTIMAISFRADKRHLNESLTYFEIYDGLDKICEEQLASILDDGFSYYIDPYEDDKYVAINLYFEDDEGEHSVFNFNDIKDDIFTFIEYLNEDYKILKIRFNKMTYNYDQLSDDDFYQDFIENLDIIIEK
jgi:hypothetical protein